MNSRYLTMLVAALLLASAVALSACGDDSEDSSDGGATAAQETDGAFIIEMTAHHEAAIEMAQIATERAEHPEVKQLAQSIITSQGSEIQEMETIHQRLFNEPAAGAEHGTLGLSEEAAGMTHDMEALETAKPFDQVFIDMMIPHHQGAIRMARLELADGEDAELHTVASAIIAAQTAEIEQMNAWRQKWYGAPSPAGGVPAEGEESSAPAEPPAEGDPGAGMEGMEH